MGHKQFCKLWPALILVFCAVEAARAQVADTTAPGTLDADVQAIISGYRANRALFPFATADMVETSGFARTMEDKLQYTSNTYWVDPNRGFLPQRVESSVPPYDKPGIVTIFNEFLQSSTGGWLPSRWLLISLPPNSRELPLDEVAVDWNVQERPGAEVFRVAVTPGESFTFDMRTIDYGPIPSYRVTGSEIDLDWFKDDGSIAAPDGAIELRQAGTAAKLADAVGESARDPWLLVIVFAVSVSTGFGGLLVFDWIRRRRKLGSHP
jgi:hypothetical protein